MRGWEAYCIDLFTIFGTDPGTGYSSEIASETLPIGFKGASFCCALQMPTTFAILEFQAVVEKPMYIIGSDLTKSLCRVVPFRKRIRGFDLHSAVSGLC